MKRTLWILLTPVLVLSVLIALIDGFVLPQVADWARREIETYSHRHLPVDVQIEELTLRLFKPAVQLVKIRILPKESLKEILTDPIEIERIRASMDLFDLLVGRIEIASLRIEKVNTRVALDPLLESKGPPRALPLDEIFRWSEKIPLRRVRLDGVRVEMRSKKENLAIGLDTRALSLYNEGPRWEVNLSIPATSIDVKDQGRLEVAVLAQAMLSAQEFELSELLVRKEDLVLHVEGRVQDPAQLPLKPRLQLKAYTDIALTEVAKHLGEFKPQWKVPDLQGKLHAEADLNLNGKSFESLVKAKTDQVQIGKFVLGSAELEGRITPDSARIPKISIQHPAGLATLNETEFSLQEPYQFRSDVQVSELDLQKVFRAINLHNIPVNIDLKGKLHCEGQAQSFGVTCGGTAQAQQLVVRSDNNDKGKVIVALKDMETEGEVRITSEDASFATKLRIGGTHGEVKGRVGFDDGFKIDFKSPEVRFRDVEDLASLHFEGTAAMEGSTHGDSDRGLFDIQINARDFVFENYRLGNVKTLLQYRAGQMHLKETQLNLGKTQAQGDIVVDLGASRIQGNVRAQTDLADIVTIFERIWKFPLEVQAPGQADMSFSGPLNFWKMDYQLNADFRGGRLQGDSFESLTVKAAAEQGNMKIEKLEMRKGAAVARASGGISSNQELNLLADVNGFRLEESEMINRIRNNISGLLTFSTEIKGKTTAPDMALRGSLSDIVVDETEIPSSFFKFHLTGDYIQGETNLFGNKIQGDLQLPFKPSTVPMRVRLKTTDWNFTSLLSLVGASNLQNEYESNLSAEIDLKSESGQYDRTDGNILIRQVLLKRGSLSLKNSGPAEIQLNGGDITFKNLNFEGPNRAAIKLRGERFRLDQLNIGVQANTDLRLLHMFVPFLEDIGGPLNTSASIGGSLTKPQLLGSAMLNDAFVKLKGFPHPLEKIRAEVSFSQSRVLIQSVKGQIAGGTFNGEGSVIINGFGDIPVNIRGRAENLNLVVPDKVRSSGNADLAFSGKWFPYTLSGVYTVQSALVQKEFGDGDSTLGTPKVNSYLPKVLRESNFDPVILDLQMQMQKNVVIKNSLMDGQLTGNLQIKGPPQSPILLGKITTEKGTQIIFKDKPFDVITGVINFNNPSEINPELYLATQARVDEYDVNVLIQGPAKTMNIRMTSSPPLSEQDIISLLALGVTSARMETTSAAQKEKQVQAEALGIGLAQTGVKKNLENTFGVNVNVTSSFDSTKNISVQKVVVGRKITSRLNAAYSRPLNAEQGSQEFKLQYQINNNVSAIGSYEDREQQDGTLLQKNDARQSIFGLDLEFKREFK